MAAAASVAAAHQGAGEDMNLQRTLRHLSSPGWLVRRAFSQETLAAIEREIVATEGVHGGEVRFAVEGNLSAPELWRGLTARERAVEMFARLGVWDTHANNGVLIFVLWADHDVEIVADRGFNGKVTNEEWAEVCQRMEVLFKANEPRRAVVEGVRAVGSLIAKHFPASDRNELPNRPVVL